LRFIETSPEVSSVAHSFSMIEGRALCRESTADAVAGSRTEIKAMVPRGTCVFVRQWLPTFHVEHPNGADWNTPTAPETRFEPLLAVPSSSRLMAEVRDIL